MNIVTLFDIVGVAFLVAAAFQANPRHISSGFAGLSLIAIAHLIIPLF